MSVRRLADEAVQPASFIFSQENLEWAHKIIAKYPEGRQQSAVIPLLMRAQEQDGWVTRASIEYVGEMLDMPLIRVLEVATFYTQFQLAPVGTRAHVQVCGTTPCMLRGAGELIELCKKKIHPEPLHLNAEGTMSWEEVECQGACVNAPMIMIFKDAYEDLTPERLEEIIDAFEAGEGVLIIPGPQIDRITSAPIGKMTSLSDESAIIKIRDPVLPGDSKVKISDADRPIGIERPEQPDELQLISGVDPEVESKLHELGIFTYVQIAGWGRQERAWMDRHLRFKGRIEREEWAKQAEALARGGIAEYEQVFGKKPR